MATAPADRPPPTDGSLLAANLPPVAEAGSNRTGLPWVSLSFDGSASYDPDLTGNWSAGPRMPTHRGQPASAVVGDRLYAIGGYQKDGPSDVGRMVNVTEVLDTGTLAWTKRTDMPTARRGATGLSFEGRVRVYGGVNSSIALIDLVESYNPTTDSWAQLEPMPRREQVVLTAAVGSDIYIWSNLQEFWVQTDGGGPWFPLAPPPESVAYAALISVGSTLYLTGYHFFPPPGGPVLFAYDTGLGVWETRAPPSVVRCNHAGVELRGGLAVLSGETCSGQDAFVAENEAYDPRTDTWHMMPPIPTPRDEFAYGVVGDCIYTAGGSGVDFDTQYDVTEIYCAPLQFDWDFGDGATAGGERAAHAYSAPGTYTVTLTVTDPLGAQGTDTLTVTITGGRPPVARALAASGEEGSPVLLDASASSDPDGDLLEFRWDFDVDGTWDTLFSPDPTATHVWGDDFAGTAVVEVTDGTNSATATASVSVGNTLPLAGPVDVRTTGSGAEVVLRVAGEKYHDVSAVLYRNGTAIGNATIVRLPGSPDTQSRLLGTMDAGNRTYSVEVTYTPDDDPVNGRPWGATPAWIVLDQGTVRTTLHHMFNARHPDTWTWTVDDLEGYLAAPAVSFEVSVYDPGSDDLILTWDFGDGHVETQEFLADPPTGPDPLPSPNVSPRSITASVLHTYAAPGIYSATLTISDDDGGTIVLTFSVTG